MGANQVKKKLKEGILSVGSWIQIGFDSTVAEILSEVGFDWLAIDCEHTSSDIAEVAALVNSVSGKACEPFVRVKANDTLSIRRALDAGATGVIVPLVNSANEAAQAVAAAKFPPAGIRGFAFTKANAYGEQFDEYTRTANEEILVIVMIETREAVEHIDSILQVEGVDGVFIGPYDMSGSYGIPGQVDSPIVREACKTVVTACTSAGKVAGLHIVTPTETAVMSALSDGFTLLALGMDMVFLQQSSKAALKIAWDVSIK